MRGRKKARRRSGASQREQAAERKDAGAAHADNAGASDQESQQDTQRRDSRGKWPLWIGTLPIHLTLVLILVISLQSIVPGLLHEDPISPGESGLVLEGVRSMRGLPVHEPASSGHATSMYGPLMPHTLGLAYRLFGVRVVTGRLINFGAMLVLVVLLTRALLNRPSLPAFVPGVVLLIGVHNKALEYTTETRPDMVAWFFGGLGLILMFRGFERKTPQFYALGVAALVIGFLYKQTAALFALVPLVTILTYRDVGLRSQLAYAAAPAGAVLFTVLAIRMFFPMAYHYMFWLPSQYSLHLREYPFYLIGLIGSCSLFVYFLLDWLVHTGAAIGSNRLRWVLSSVAIIVPGSTLFLTKIGGDANSIYPALVCMIGFCICQQHTMVTRIVALTPLRQFFASACVALLMFVSTVSIGITYWQSRYLHGDPPFVVRGGMREDGTAYRRVVAFVRGLPGRTVSLDDPTIPYFATGYIGRQLNFEMGNLPDDGKYGQRIPPYLLNYVYTADYVVSVRMNSPYSESSKFFALQRRFDLLKSFGTYHVWKKR